MTFPVICTEPHANRLWTLSGACSQSLSTSTASICRLSIPGTRGAQKLWSRRLPFRVDIASARFITVARLASMSSPTVLSVFLALNKPLSDSKKTLTGPQLWRVIKLIDPSGEDFLSNFGDVHHEGLHTILKKAVDSLLAYCQTDAEMMSSVIHSGVGIVELYQAVKTVTGRTGIIQKKPNWGHDLGGHTIYLATEANQIKLSDAVTLDDSGHTIPLSQRFDQTKADIRY